MLWGGGEAAGSSAQTATDVSIAKNAKQVTVLRDEVTSASGAIA
jgi:hypothetical protein